MNPDLLTLLKSVDTPTVCDAIELVQGRRGGADFTQGAIFATLPEAAPMVGYACTAKVAARHPAPEDNKGVRERRLAYYRHVAESRRPAVMVVQDLDHPRNAGAFLGRANAAVHKGLGVAGVVTNGLVRNLGQLPQGFPVVATGTGPSHAFGHVTGFGLPVEVFGVTVKEGVLIHADRHGAVIVPDAVVAELPNAIRTIASAEDAIVEAARRQDFDVHKLEEAWRRFEAIRPTR